MAGSGEKPYRVYKGGRQKGKVPSPGRDRQRAQRREPQQQQGRVRRRPQRTFSRGRAVVWSLVGVVLLLVVWSVLGYLRVSSGVSGANSRLQTAAPGIDAVLTPT